MFKSGIFFLINWFSRLNKFLKKFRRFTLLSFIVLSIVSFLLISIFSILIPYIFFEYKSDGVLNERYERNIDAYYDDIEFKVNEFRNVFYKNNKYDSWQMPNEPVNINILVDDISRINEQNSTIRIKGRVNALWHPQKSIKNIYLEDSETIKQFREDFLQNSYLNFASTEEQFFQKIAFYEKEDGFNNVIYRFEGDFPLVRNLSKFPFDSATWEIRVITDLNAASFYFTSDSQQILFPSDAINAYEITNLQCFEGDEDLYSGCNIKELKPLNNYISAAYSDPKNQNYAYAVMDYGATSSLKGGLRRSVISSFTRYIVPIIFGILVLSMTDQLSSREAWEIRVAIPPTVLLTFIFMQNSYHQQLPQISYLTWLDQIYLIGYTAASLMLFNAVINKGDWFNKKIIDKYTRLRLTYAIRTVFTLLILIGPLFCYFADSTTLLD